MIVDLQVSCLLCFVLVLVVVTGYGYGLINCLLLKSAHSVHHCSSRNMKRYGHTCSPVRQEGGRTDRQADRQCFTHFIWDKGHAWEGDKGTVSTMQRPNHCTHGRAL